MKALVLVVVLTGCGPVANPHRPGMPCTTEPEECFSAATKGICDNGTWLEYPCDGTLALTDGGTLIGKCDLPRSPRLCIQPPPLPGDFCPSAYEGHVSRCMSANTYGACASQKWRSCSATPIGDRPGCEEFLWNGSEAEGMGISLTGIVHDDAGC